jgi:hypothetical protein
MPQLGAQQLEKIYLPSTAAITDEAEKAFVVINHNIPASLLDDTDTAYQEVSKGIRTISKQIVEWNLTEIATGAIAEINPVNVGKMLYQDLNHIDTIIGEDIKKATGGLDESPKEI